MIGQTYARAFQSCIPSLSFETETWCSYVFEDLMCPLRYVYEDADRQWDYHDTNKDNFISWEEYKENAFGPQYGMSLTMGCVVAIQFHYECTSFDMMYPFGRVISRCSSFL